MDDGEEGRSRLDPRVARTRADILDTALELLVERGVQAVTQAQVARQAGYARATVYKHWPSRQDLVREAFLRLGQTPHHEPTGALHADLVAEVITFRSGMERAHLDRALATLALLARDDAELAQVRLRLRTDGERVIRALLAPVLDGDRLEAATLMLCGAVLHGALAHGTPPDDAVVSACVDLMLDGATGSGRAPHRT